MAMENLSFEDVFPIEHGDFEMCINWQEYLWTVPSAMYFVYH